MTATLIFGTDGVGRGLYTDAIDLRQVGALQVERATTIEFDNTDQVWRVRDTSGRELFSSSRRDLCLEWEQRVFSESLNQPAKGKNHASET